MFFCHLRLRVIALFALSAAITAAVAAPDLARPAPPEGSESQTNLFVRLNPRSGDHFAFGRFSGDKPMARASVDIPFKRDLSRANGISFDLTIANVVEFNSFTCYMHSGGGWYSVPFAAGKEGKVCRVTIDKVKSSMEEEPSGWKDVDVVRISGWRGGTNDAAFSVGNIAVEAKGGDVIVLQAQSCVQKNPAERKSCADFAARLADSLRVAGLDTVVMSDTDVDASVFEGVKALMLPYNPSLPDDVASVIVDFVKRGGKVFATYNCDRRILGQLGIKSVSWTRPESAGKSFGGFVRNGVGLKGQPSFAPQESWATMVVKPESGSEVVAWWGKPGKPLDIPALVRCPKGIYMAHVWAGGSKEESLALIRSIVLYMMPEKRAVLEASVAAGEAKKRATIEWAKSIKPPAAPEFRAFWCHSPLGIGGGRTWDESIAILKKGGFNAMIANLAWGGSADYPSEVLPRSTPDLDAFAECKAACRRHGVGFHVWKVCYNLGGKRAPQEFVDKLKAEGRLQKSLSGEEKPWLCPSHPANLKLESDAFLEIARKGADGIHLDYIRYPGGESCFCQGCRERFEKKYGAVENWPSDVRKVPELAKLWAQFKRDNITALVRDVSKRVRREAPGVKISAAVFQNFNSCAEVVGQDWPAWCRDGLLDFVCPMDYTESTAIFTDLVTKQSKVVGNVPIYPGIGLFIGGATPADKFRTVAEQILECRKIGCRGFAVFEFNAAAEAVLPYLALGPTLSSP